MKLLTLIIPLVLLSPGLNAQSDLYGIDSLLVRPESPSMDDNISVIIHATLPHSPCGLIHDSTIVVQVGNSIHIETHYWAGFLTAVCSTIDSISLGQLAGGHYELIANFEHDIFTDSDSIEFFVGPATALSSHKSDENRIQLFPNPATNHFTLQLSQPANIEIRDMAGRLVKQLRLQQGSNTIDVQEFRKGVYHVIARSEGWSGREKLVVQ